jgi:hypothetical protein
VVNFLYGDGRVGLKHASLWWRDLWYLGSEDDGYWFRSNINSRLGDGTAISFWKDTWLGTEPLMLTFETLFNKSSQQDCAISMMGYWENESWNWNFGWLIALSNNDLATFHELSLLLEQVQPGVANSDRRRWIPHPACVFTVKSTYVFLLNRSDSDQQLDSTLKQALVKLWSANVPSKVSIFGWRLLLGKLPTREALYSKGIITNQLDRYCVFCRDEFEDIDHVFFKCNATATVWECIFKWVGINTPAFSSTTQHTLLFGNLFKGKKTKRMRHIIWLAITWCIWRARNNILFRGVIFNVSSLANQILYTAWFWLIGRQKINVDFSFLDWYNNPLKCIQSI